MTTLDFWTLKDLLLKRKALRRSLLATAGLQELRIAVLGGSTTDEVVSLLELLLLSSGFRPTFYQSDYGRFYEDAVYDSSALTNFKPDIVYIHTSYRNALHIPPINCREEELPAFVAAELTRFREIWDALDREIGCQIIQNNFEIPPYGILGNLDAVAAGGRSRFLMQLNIAFSQEAANRPKLTLQDVLSISARVGLREWFDWDRYFSYKILLTAGANLELARSITALVKSIYGKSRKVLVLDLDNTLWGGVIGDDGVDQIQIGRETPIGEAYITFQEYCLALRERGILLAVCSKNEESIAKSGFEHPSSVLKLEHFSSFRANWEPKPDNILAIAAELNLSVDSFVFIDDNPAERALVAAQLPTVAVPDIGSDVIRYASTIEQGRYFEQILLSKEDLQRAAAYAKNSKLAQLEKTFSNYGDYLDSLEMVAEIGSFKTAYLERIAQLTNKTNQFNLTTRRYSLAELEKMSAQPEYICLYGKLRDRFGDHGLISVVLAKRESEAVRIDLWLMSCRVLKREMEYAMLDAIARGSMSAGVKRVYGDYIPTTKNTMVADHYPKLGFTVSDRSDTSVTWSLDLDTYRSLNKHIRVVEPIDD
jgi:FkbH-like protein